MRKSTKKFKKQAKPKPQKLKKINPTKFFPSLEEVKNETEKKRSFESDSEEDFRKKRKKTEFSSEKKAKTNDAWCPTEEEQKILDEGDSDSSVINESDIGFNAKELEAELLGLAGDPVNTRPYRVRPVDPETARARSHAKRNRLVGKPKSQYLGVSWCNKKQQWHGRVWVSHLKKLEWVGYFEDEVKCGIEVNKRCIKLGLPIKNPELEIIENPSTDAEDSDQKTTDAKKPKKEEKPQSK